MQAQIPLSRLNKTCSILAQSGIKDAYGIESFTLVTLVSNWPCAVAADVTTYGREAQGEVQYAKDFRRVFMRVPSVPIDQRNWLSIDGTVCNVIDVINPGGRDHHLEVIIENVTGS